MKAVLLPPCSTSVCVSKGSRSCDRLYLLCTSAPSLVSFAPMQRFTARRPQQPRSTARSTRLILLLPFRTDPGHHTKTRRTASFTLKQTRYPAEATGPAIIAFPYNGLVIQGSLPSIRRNHGDAWDCPGCANSRSGRFECLHLRVWRALAGHASCRAQKAMVDRRPHRSKSYESVCCVQATWRRAWIP